MNGLNMIKKMNLVGHPVPTPATNLSAYAQSEGKYNPLRRVTTGEVVVVGVALLWLFALLLSVGVFG